jgi:hypothetical protein
MFLRNIFEALARTGEGKAAVVGWGRGMGHKGHMMLASSVITHANQLSADPYFVVSRTVGKDDPITPDEKLAIYKKVFPEQGHIFQTATDEIPDLTRVLSDLNRQGYTSATIVLGADQVKAFQYLKNYNGKADKAGNVPYTFDKLDVISRQETSDPSKDQEGPRATPMRAVLMDPSKSEQEQFQVWRDAMNPQVSDDEVRNLMMKAKERMQALVKPKKGVAEFAMSGGDDGEDPTDNYPCYDCGSTIFLHHTKLCELAEDNAIRDLPSKPGSQHWTGEVPKGLHPIPRLAEATFKKSPYGRTAASQQRARELLNPPKPPEPKKDEGIMGLLAKPLEKKSKISSADMRKYFEKEKSKELPKYNNNKQKPQQVYTRSDEREEDMEEGFGSKLAGLGLAGAMALGSAGANARVVPGQDNPDINRLTGKPNVTQVAPSDVKPATPAGFNKEYLQSVIDGKHPRPMISKEKAAELLMKMNAVDEAKKKGADGKACWDGYRYNGTENGKDSCVKVSEDVQDVMDALINKIIVNEAVQNNRK